MSIGGIGSTSSFYQDDQSYWSNAQSQNAAQSAATALIDVMGQAQVNRAKGLAAIANGTALKRVNSQLIAAVQSALGINPASSSSSSSSSTASSSASSASTKVQPASGTGTIPVTTTTTLSSLGILPGGTLTFGDGGNTPTVYTSTGTDTINAINNGPAFLSASINSSGKLTVTARNTTASVIISGSGTDSTAIGFGNNNNTFQPVQPTASNPATSASSSTASSSSSSTSSSTNSSSSTKKSSAVVPSAFEQSASSAASILSASGISGNLVNMLA
jgi:hypothetical protein